MMIKSLNIVVIIPLISNWFNTWGYEKLLGLIGYCYSADDKIRIGLSCYLQGARHKIFCQDIIRIQKGNIFTARNRHAGISCGRHAMIIFAYQCYIILSGTKLLQNMEKWLLTSVINNNNLIVTKCLLTDTCQRPSDLIFRYIIAGND